MDLKEKIRSIENFPEEGVIFRDITTLLKEGDALREAIDQIQTNLDGVDFDLILGPESRGFIFGMPVAYELHKPFILARKPGKLPREMPLAYNLKKGFVPVRKKGKLPAEVISKEYALEYGTAVIEVHKDAIQPGQKVVIVDDLLATGGTAKAIIEMVESVGAEVVGLAFLIELDFLHGRDVLEGYNISSVLHY